MDEGCWAKAQRYTTTARHGGRSGVITSAGPGSPTRVGFARGGVGSARDLLLLLAPRMRDGVKREEAEGFFDCASRPKIARRDFRKKALRRSE